MSREAMKLALEALEKHAELGLFAGATITILKQALEQPEPEPLAWANRVIGGRKWLSIHASKGASDKWLEYRIKEQAQGEKYEQVALYTSQPKREPEPVAWTLLLVGENTGIIGKAGETFESHPKYYKRVDVYTSPLKHEPPCKTGSQCTTKCMECAEQKPVAVVSGYYGGKCVVLPTDPARIFNSGTAFYTHPQGNRQSHRSRTRH